MIIILWNLSINSSIIWLTLVLLNPDIPSFANSVDPDQLASKKPTDLDLHCLPLSMRIYSNNWDQVIWLAENQKWAWHLNLFSRTRVKLRQPYQRLWSYNVLWHLIWVYSVCPGLPVQILNVLLIFFRNSSFAWRFTQKMRICNQVQPKQILCI